MSIHTRPPRHIRIRHAAATLPLMLLAFGACRKEAPPADPPPPPEVTVQTVATRTVPVSYEFVAVTEASKVVEIRARVQGFLQSRNFEEGGLVDEGEMLYTIDPRSFQADLEIAKAQLGRGQARLQNASRQVARLAELAQQNAASPKELDDWQLEELQARADVRLAEANVALADLNVSYTRILAPMRGRIARTNKEPGALVDAGVNSLLTTVYQTDPMFVSFSIPERDWLRWREDVAAGRIRHPGIKTLTDVDRNIPHPTTDPIPVSITLLDGTPYPVQGQLNFLDATVSAETGTARARAVFDNTSRVRPDGRVGDEALKPGQFVRAKILGWERPNSITVPQRAVTQTPMGGVVFVVDAEGRSAVRPVKTGDWLGDDWIILSGLKPGDKVIVEGFAKAPPGTPVKIAREYDPKAGAGGSAAAGPAAKPESAPASAR